MKPVASRVAGINPSFTVRLGTLARELQAKGEDVISLGVGEPDFPTPRHVIEAARAAMDDPAMTKYVSSLGLRELREAVAEKSVRDNGIPATADNVLVAPTKHALFLTLAALVEPGEEVLMPDPGWVSYEPMTRLVGGVPVPVRAADDDGFVLNPDALAEAITPRSKVVILNTPSNPAGTVFPEVAIRGIADLCRDHDLYLVSDEIYEKILYEGRHVSPASLDGMFDRTVTVHGFSKTYAMTGWRIGWLVADKPLVRQAVKVQEQTITCVPGFIQRAGVAALRGPTGPVEAMVQEFAARRRIVLRLLEGVPCSRPDGAFYVFPRVDSDDSFAFCERLLQDHGVAVTPGAAFGRGGEGHVRISYAASRRDVEEGVRRFLEGCASSKPLRSAGPTRPSRSRRTTGT